MAHRVRRSKYYKPIKPPKTKTPEEQQAEQMGLIKRLLGMLFFGFLRGG